MSANRPATDPTPCHDVRQWIGARITNGRVDLDDTSARAHLARCPKCRDAYRSQMADAARLGRTVQRVHGAGDPGGEDIARPRLGRKQRAVLLLVAVSAVIFMVSRVGKGLRSDPTLPVVWQEGEMWVAGEPVGASFGPRMGLRGDLVQTGSDGRGSLAFDTGRIEIAPRTTLLVESAVGERVRLVGGAVRLVGDGDLNTPFGIVRVAGGAVDVTLVGDELTVASIEGRVVHVSAQGERHVPPGAALRGATGALVLVAAND